MQRIVCIAYLYISLGLNHVVAHLKIAQYAFPLTLMAFSALAAPVSRPHAVATAEAEAVANSSDLLRILPEMHGLERRLTNAVGNIDSQFNGGAVHNINQARERLVSGWLRVRDSI